MGWKNIRDHFKITHIVRVEGENVCIGSAYIPAIIEIGPDGTCLRRYGDSRRSNTDLFRYQQELDADPALVKRLLETPDTFERSLPVFTYRDGEIIEKSCEEYGWPNVCHDGELQYDNKHSADKAVVVGWAKRDIAIGLEWNERETNETITKQAELICERQTLEAQARRLEEEYPTA